ncbi:MAG: NAD-dependent succinate-semialdehyde dehydrogenase [Bacteriovoracaceae bacterium]|jgi:succinate-semialdehyde dehydrogenase / glutarate-semialdehyde dehydrogenase|nr:NAD-dependent succinate-semialdehyde dehydrogenase [Bacteriovoracaceae bacterium]
MISPINPATNTVITTYEFHSDQEIEQKLSTAHITYKNWSELDLRARLAFVSKLSQVLLDTLEPFARQMSIEVGKPITESRAEVKKCALLCDSYVTNSKKWLEDELVTADGLSHHISYEPLGVILSIMPWNYPLWQVIRFAVPTLISGNTTLLKHSNVTPGCALMLEKAFMDAGFMPGCFATLLTDHQSVTGLIEDPRVCGISLTGSTTAGALVGEVAGANIKKVVLELGGSDPFIVLEDADIEKACEGAVRGRMQNTGQSCIAAKRFIIHSDVYDQFVEKFKQIVESKIIGDPLDEKTQIGPLVSLKALEEIDSQVVDATSLGATVVCGGERIEGEGFYYSPTILCDLNEKMRVFTEEVFGPVALVFKVDDDASAIELANASEFGLGASVWSKDLDRAMMVARKIESGTVFINSYTKSDPRMPFGGIKKSGLGRELSHFGLKEFCNIKAYNLYDC